MHYYSFHVGDYLYDTAHLSNYEDLAFRRLLDLYYTSEKPIPNNTHEVSRRIRMPNQINAVQTVLEEFFMFDMERNCWFHKRCDETIAAYQAKAERNREVGKLGGRPKFNPNGIPQETQVVSKDNPNQEPITNNHKKEERGAPSAAATPPVRPVVPRGTRLPLDFVLTAEWGEWALQEQKTWSPEHVHKVAEKFADHWRAAPGSRGTKLDWQATWRNWVRNEGAMRADQKPKLTLMEVMDREDQNAA